jgi:hypothetical protein
MILLQGFIKRLQNGSFCTGNRILAEKLSDFFARIHKRIDEFAPPKTQSNPWCKKKNASV